MITERRRADGTFASSYAWRVSPSKGNSSAVPDVLVVEDTDPHGRSMTNDAAGVVRDLWELRPDLLRRVPLIPYRDSAGEWDALRVGPDGRFLGFVGLGSATEAEAVAKVLALAGW